MECDDVNGVFCDKSRMGSAGFFNEPVSSDDVLSIGVPVEWLWMWVFRLARWLKVRLQIGHLWGDSSKWVTL
jgi:hypothetical protein